MEQASAQPLHPAYRPDIDGLRAVAVASVVVFHAFPAAFPGGFVGVDVFFVISGYLISQIILREQAARRFSFLTFYARRVRRILPALLLVLVASFGAGWLMLFSQDFKALGLHMAGAAGFASNFVLLREAGYFDTASELKPLLHLWSLAIEEQFYLFWPALLALAARWRFKVLALTLGLTLGSLAFCVWLTPREATLAFFLSPARFWEILAGALLAVREVQGQVTPQPRLSWYGGALLLAGFGLISEARPFPGVWALLPVLGTALLIAAGPRGTLNRMLALPPVVGLGLISYPLYLWHWPILTFLRLHFGSATPPWALVAGVLAALALAFLTYRLIERPLRFGRAGGRAALVLLAALVGLGYLGFNTWQREGLRFRAANKGNPAEFDWRGEWRHKACFLEARETGSARFAPECDAPAGTGPRVVLWGDSHGAALYPGLAAEARARGVALGQYTAAGCPPVPGFVSRDRAACATVNALVREKLAQNPPDVLLLTGFWTLYFGSDARYNGMSEAMIEEALAGLKGLGIRRIVLVGPLPGFRREVPKFAAPLFRPGEETRTRQELDESVFAMDARLAALAGRAGVSYAAPLQVLCDARGCLASTQTERFEPMQWDANHLTSAGARYVMRALLARDAGLLP